MADAIHRVGIEIDVDSGNIAARIKAIEKQLKAMEKTVARMDKKGTGVNDTFKKLDNRLGKVGNTVRRMFDGFKKLFTMFSKFSFIAMAAELAIFTAGLLAIKLAMMTGRGAASLYNIALKGLSVTAAAVGVALSTAAAAMRQFSEAQLSPFLGGGAKGNALVARTGRGLGASTAGLLGAEGTAQLMAATMRGGFSEQQGIRLAQAAALQTNFDPKAAAQLINAFSTANKTGNLAPAIQAIQGTVGFREGTAISASNTAGLMNLFTSGALTNPAFAQQGANLGGTLIGTAKTSFVGIKDMFADAGVDMLEPMRKSFLQIANILRENFLALQTIIQRFGADSMGPTMVTIFDRMMKFITNNIIDHLENIKEMGENFVGFFRAIRNFFVGMGDFLGQFEPAANVIIDMFKAASNANRSGLFRGFSDSLVANADQVKKFGAGMGRLFGGIFTFFERGNNAFFNNLDRMTKIFDAMVDSLFPAILEFFNGAMPIFKKLPDIIEGLSSVLSFLAPIIRTLVNAVMTLYDGIRSLGGFIGGSTGGGLVDAAALALLFGGKGMFGKGGRLAKGVKAGGRGAMNPLALAALVVGGGMVGGTADTGSMMQMMGLTTAGYGLHQGAGMVRAAGGLKPLMAKGLARFGAFQPGLLSYIAGTFIGYKAGEALMNNLPGAQAAREFLSGKDNFATDTLGQSFYDYFYGFNNTNRDTRNRQFFDEAGQALALIELIEQAQAEGRDISSLVAELGGVLGHKTNFSDRSAEDVYKDILSAGEGGLNTREVLLGIVDSKLEVEKQNLIDTQKVAIRALGEFADELDTSRSSINEFITAFGYDPMNLRGSQLDNFGLMYAASQTLFDRNRAIMPNFATTRTVQMERQASASAALNALMTNPNFTSADVTDFFSKQAAYEVSLGNPVDLATLSGVQELKFHMSQGRFGPVGSDSYNRMKDLTETAERTIFEEMSGRYFLGMDTLTAFGSGANGGQIQLGALDKYLTAIQLQRQAVSGTAGMGFSKRLGILGDMGFAMDSQVFSQFLKNAGLSAGDIEFNEDGSILNKSLMDFAAKDERFDEEEFTRALSIAFIESDMGSATEAQTVTLEKAIRDIPNSMTNWSIYLNDGSDGGGSYITLSGPDGYLKVPVGDQPVSIDGHLRGLME